jgi:Vitamin K-dependent gamma-carboxylase
MIAMDLDSTYRLIVVLASAGVLVASLEFLTIRVEFEDSGLFSWDVLRTMSRTTFSVGTGRPRYLVSHPFCVPALAGTRALAALLLIFFSNNYALSTACIVAIVAVGIVMFWRAPLGQDGSDQMSLITFTALAVHNFFPRDVHVAQASLWFIAVQGCLSYFVAGIAKVVSPVWRSGEAVGRIVSTRTYGSTRSAALVRGREGACMVLSWFLMAFECTFPLALAFGQTGFAVFAALGICFHIANAVIMGLNTFVWAFVATYPAILFCAVGLSR